MMIVKKVFLCVLLIVLILVFGITAKIFLIGEPVDNSIVVCDVEELDDQINIYVTTPASAIAFTDPQLRQEGTTLYITIRKVLVSSLFSSGTKMIWIEKNDLTEIVLGGEVIWTAH